MKILAAAQDFHGKEKVTNQSIFQIQNSCPVITARPIFRPQD